MLPMLLLNMYYILICPPNSLYVPICQIFDRPLWKMYTHKSTTYEVIVINHMTMALYINLAYITEQYGYTFHMHVALHWY